MPKSRIDSAFWEDPHILLLSWPAQFLLVHILTACADDAGRLVASPQYLRKQAFGHDERITLEEVRALRDEIVRTLPDVILYEVGGLDYMQILGFQKGRRGRRRAVSSRLPAPPEQEEEARDARNFGIHSEIPAPGAANFGLNSENPAPYALNFGLKSENGATEARNFGINPENPARSAANSEIKSENPAPDAANFGIESGNGADAASFGPKSGHSAPTAPNFGLNSEISAPHAANFGIKPENPTPNAPNLGIKSEIPAPTAPNFGIKPEIPAPVAANFGKKPEIPAPNAPNSGIKAEQDTPDAGKNSPHKAKPTPVGNPQPAKIRDASEKVRARARKNLLSTQDQIKDTGNSEDPKTQDLKTSLSPDPPVSEAEFSLHDTKTSRDSRVLESSQVRERDSSYAREDILSRTEKNLRPRRHTPSRHSQDLAALETAFSEITHIPPPDRTTDAQKRAANVLWWSPLRTIGNLCGWDLDRARDLMQATVDQMTEQNLTIASPKSIVRVATALHAKASRGLPTGRVPPSVAAGLAATRKVEQAGTAPSQESDTAARVGLLAALATLFPHADLTETNFLAYAQALQDLDLDLLAAALRRCSTKHRFFPTPAEIREEANALRRRQDGVPDPYDAWEEVCRACRNGVLYARPQVSHPLIEEAVRAIGGWTMLAMAPEHDLVAHRAHFLQAYAAKVARACQDRDLVSGAPAALADPTPRRQLPPALPTGPPQDEQNAEAWDDGTASPGRVLCL